MYCEGNSLTINLSFDMPEGYETANGTFDPTALTPKHTTCMCMAALPRRKRCANLLRG